MSSWTKLWVRSNYQVYGRIFSDTESEHEISRETLEPGKEILLACCQANIKLTVKSNTDKFLNLDWYDEGIFKTEVLTKGTVVTLRLGSVAPDVRGWLELKIR